MKISSELFNFFSNYIVNEKLGERVISFMMKKYVIIMCISSALGVLSAVVVQEGKKSM